MSVINIGDINLFHLYFSETKIVLKGDNSAQLLDLAKKAESAGLPNYIVHDAGRTQVCMIH